MIAVFKREFKSYFTSPMGFIILAVMTLFLSLAFYMIYIQGLPNVANVFNAMSGILIFIIPFISMRLFSEEKKHKVDQVLLTAPIKITSIVLGKLLAALAIWSVGLSITLIFQFVVATYVSLNWGIFFYALFGMLLFGAAMIAIGMFFSSLTESSVIAAAVTVALFVIIMLIDGLTQSVDSQFIKTLVSAISFIQRYGNFVSGVFSLNDIIYYLSITGIFSFLTVCSVSKRRWA